MKEIIRFNFGICTSVFWGNNQIYALFSSKMVRHYVWQSLRVVGEIGPNEIGPYKIGPSNRTYKIGPYKIGPLQKIFLKRSYFYQLMGLCLLNIFKSHKRQGNFSKISQPSLQARVGGLIMSETATLYILCRSSNSYDI